MFVCLCVGAEFDYLSVFLAPEGGVEKWEGADDGGDCKLRVPRGHTLKGGAGPGTTKKKH